MKRSCIIYLASVLFIAGLSLAQTNAVFFDDDDLYGSGTGALRPIAEGITNYFKPAFGVLHASTDPFTLAETVVVTNGTITAGTVTNTWVEDGSYLEVSETGVWETYFTFTNEGATAAEQIIFHGRYEGNPSHDVLVYAYDFVDGAYELVEPVSAGYIPSGTEDATYRWSMPTPQTNFVSTNGATIVLFEHDGAAVASHDFFVDYLSVVYADVILSSAGVWYAFSDVELDADVNITVDATNATVTTIDAGWYKIGWYTSFTGKSNTTFTIRHLTNSQPTDIEMWRSIGSEPQIGSASAFGYKYLQTGTTNSWQIRADSDDAWFTLVNGHSEVIKVGN